MYVCIQCNHLAAPKQACTHTHTHTQVRRDKRALIKALSAQFSSSRLAV